MRMGNKTSYTAAVASRLVQELSEGKPLRQICREQNVPWRTVYEWINRRKDFAERIAKARELGYDAIAEECLAIANTPVTGKITTTKEGGGIEVKEEDMLGHRKLQIWTRLQLLAKWNPKKYGDRVTHAGDPSAPLTLELKGSDVNG